MNRQQHLIAILAEEAGEIVQDAMKSLRFGLDSEYEGVTNLERLRTELGQLFAVAEMLCKDGVPLKLEPVTVSDKIRKVEYYLSVSKDMGTLTED
jgi:NTP pyrophosphatase (non-canonical NTP hydrolase)